MKIITGPFNTNCLDELVLNGASAELIILGLCGYMIKLGKGIVILALVTFSPAKNVLITSVTSGETINKLCPAFLIMT
jgi:hypothetical protein